MGAGATSGVREAVKAASQAELAAVVGGLDVASRKKLMDGLESSAYVEGMRAQWGTVLKNSDKVADIAASKRSPFKFKRGDSDGEADVNLGITTVALPDSASDFGARYLATIDAVQDLCKQYLGGACKRQTVPHMSIGSVMLDKDTPEEYNEWISANSGLIAKVKAELDGASPPIRAKIQTLKINPDGCVTFQLEHDPAQDKQMSESEIDEALAKMPGDGMSEKRRFKKCENGSFALTRFQQIRLALGVLGCEIKGFYTAGHMVVVNLIDVKLMEQVPEAKQDELWAKCHQAWKPLEGEWFELKAAKCLCYVERSLNEGSVVVAPEAGKEPQAFPEGSQSAQALLGGVFASNAGGDVVIDMNKFTEKVENAAEGTWRAFQGEVRELAENSSGVRDLMKAHPKDRLQAQFKVFDKDGSGYINSQELSMVMESLGEKLSEEELAKMVAAADKDGSGTINYTEFINVITQK